MQLIAHPVHSFLLRFSIIPLLVFGCNFATAQGGGTSPPTDCEQLKLQPGWDPSTLDNCILVTDIKAGIKSTDSIIQYINELEAIDPELQADPRLQEIEAGLTIIKEYAGSTDQLKGNLIVGYSSENTIKNRDGDSRLDLGINLSRGYFPHQFRFGLKFEVEEDDNGFEESIGSALANYDYYHRQWLEPFVFAQRFTIDPLDIDQRWEAGLGFKVEWNTGWLDFKTRSRGAITALHSQYIKDEHTLSPFSDKYWDNFKVKGSNPENENVTKYLSGLVDKNRGGSATNETKLADKYTPQYIKDELCDKILTGDKIACDWDAFVASTLRSSVQTLADTNIRSGLNRQTSSLEFGISFALLEEYIDGSVNLIGQSQLDGSEFDFDIPKENNTVLSIRPSFRFRPFNKFELTGQYYYKRRLEDDPDNRISGENYYSYTVVDFSYDLSKRVKLILKYEDYYENAPFFLATVDVMNDPAVQQKLVQESLVFNTSLFTQLHAPRRYKKVSLNVSVPFGP